MTTEALPPCQVACPIHTDVRGYVSAIARGEIERAIRINREVNPFPSVCGRVCTRPCESVCRRAQNILGGMLTHGIPEYRLPRDVVGVIGGVEFLKQVSMGERPPLSKDGVKVIYLTAPIAFLGNGNVQKVRCISRIVGSASPQYL